MTLEELSRSPLTSDDVLDGDEALKIVAGCLQRIANALEKVPVGEALRPPADMGKPEASDKPNQDPLPAPTRAGWYWWKQREGIPITLRKITQEELTFHARHPSPTRFPGEWVGPLNLTPDVELFLSGRLVVTAE